MREEMSTMRPMRAMASFNRRATNRLIGLWAPYVPPWATIVHRGRSSGTTYRTPVAAFVRGSTMTIALPYGDDADWVKNLLVAGGGELVRLGRSRALVNPRLADRGSAGLASRLTRRSLVADLASPTSDAKE
jgi:deazaflavin-dependent oxidoreductase (nitroreductase family)